MVLEGLSEALHVSVEWLRGETDEYETDITDKRELQIRDAMTDILKQLPLDLTKTEDAFSKDLLLLMLKQYELFLDSFQFACKNYKGNTLSLIHLSDSMTVRILFILPPVRVGFINHNISVSISDKLPVFDFFVSP